MNDPRKPVESASAAPGEKRAAAPPAADDKAAAPAPAAGRASESGNPDVHKALADLQTARQNLAAVQSADRPDEAAYKADEKAALDRLRDLGYRE